MAGARAFAGTSRADFLDDVGTAVNGLCQTVEVERLRGRSLPSGAT